MNIALALTDSISAVCPIEGVRIVDPADKTTWLIWYHDSASSAERSAAQAALESFTNTP